MPRLSTSKTIRLSGLPAQVVSAGLLLALLSACATAPKPSMENKGSESSAPPPTPNAAVIAPPTSGKRGGGYYQDDGPGDNPPPNLDAIPDAQPKPEPLHKFANNAYSVLGQSYVPDTSGKAYSARGLASWYGRKFHGQRTSCGEVYDMYAMTAAHPTLPLPSYARVTNIANGKSVVVRVNDRGPFHSKRIIDLSYAAAHKLGIVRAGSAMVQVDSINPAQRSDPPPVLVAGEETGTMPVPAGEGANDNYWLQLGAFKIQSNAEQLLEKLKMRLGNLAENMQVLSLQGLYRLRLGPFNSRAEASERALQLKSLADVQATVVR